MLLKWLKLVAVLLLIFGPTGLQAQESITPGGDASGSGGTVSYSIGQVVYSTYTGTDGSVAEGVQQPFEIYVVTTVEETNNIMLSVTAYPNPAAELLLLKVESEKLKDLSYQLLDMNGKILQTQKITNNLTNIVMTSLAPSTYLLKVIQKNTELKTFKIIKK